MSWTSCRRSLYRQRAAVERMSICDDLGIEMSTAVYMKSGGTLLLSPETSTIWDGQGVQRIHRVYTGKAMRYHDHPERSTRQIRGQ